MAVAMPDRRPHIDTVEQLPRFGRVEHRHLALLCSVARAPDATGLYGTTCAGDDSVEQVTDRCRTLLDGRDRRYLCVNERHT